MGFMDKIIPLLKQNIGKAQSLVGQNADKITGGLDKVTSEINKRTDGKYADKLDKVTGTIESKLGADDEVTVDLTDEAGETQVDPDALAAEYEAEAPRVDNISD